MINNWEIGKLGNWEMEMINVFNSKSKANGIFVNVSEVSTYHLSMLLNYFIISKHERKTQIVYNDWITTNKNTLKNTVISYHRSNSFIRYFKKEKLSKVYK